MRKTRQQVRQELERQFDASVARYIVEELFQCSYAELVHDGTAEVTLAEEELLHHVVQQVKAGYPLQYAFERAYFYGYTFHVNEHVLIPRPETEELVYFILQKFGKEQLRVLDIGTGSGVIALTLKLENRHFDVTAVDISEDALHVAKRNAEELGADITFVQSDGLEAVEQPFDIIVSNPPCISENEKSLMSESTLRYEPHLALFAEDEGYALYEQWLNAIEGTPRCVAFEIGFAQKERVEQLLRERFPEAIVGTERDMHGKDRIVYALSN